MVQSEGSIEKFMRDIFAPGHAPQSLPQTSAERNEPHDRVPLRPRGRDTPRAAGAPRLQWGNTTVECY